jgi:hypothetical protein
VLPLGVAGAGMKLASLLERFVPGVATTDGGAAAAGGAGLLGVGGVKLAGLLAAGAAATAGGGLVAVHEHEARSSAHQRPAAARQGTVSASRTAPAAAAVVSTPSRPPVRAVAGPAAVPHKPRISTGHRLAPRRSPTTGRLEFSPGGAEPSPPAPRAAVAVQRAPAPAHQTVPGAASSGADSTRGEFAPQP